MAQATTSAPGDDSDLEDLIAKTGTSDDADVPTREEELPSVSVSVLPITQMCGWFKLFAYHYPKLHGCLMFLVGFGLVGLLSNYVFNPWKEVGVMGGSYLAVESAYDLSLGKVDHWCIQGGNDSCKCEDPLEPQGRPEFKSWSAAHAANKADVQFYTALYGDAPTHPDDTYEPPRPRPKIDVAFVGESVVEAMDGRWLGNLMGMGKGGRNPKDGKGMLNIGKQFANTFRRDEGADMEGVALGVAGDTSANVLWRLQHGEMPADFNPQVWWTVLGMNDLARMQCSEEIVVLGVLRIVEEIRLRKPDAKVVVNSLLPMVDYQNKDARVKMADYADFLTKDEKGRKTNTRQVPTTFRMRDDDSPVEKEDGGRLLRDLNQNNGGEDDWIKNIENKGGKAEKRDKKKKKDGKASKSEENEEKDGKSPKKKEGTKKGKQTKKEREDHEDNATKGPDLEKALERKKKALMQHDKAKIGKMFRDQTKYRPKKPVTPVLPMIRKKALPPVWSSVHMINGWLEKFCKQHDNIVFFDATPIFATKEGNGEHHLKDDLISRRGHPTEKGFKVWQQEMKNKLRKMLPEEKPQKKSVPFVGKGHVSEKSHADGEAKDEGSHAVGEVKEAKEPTEMEQPKRDSNDVGGKKPKEESNDVGGKKPKGESEEGDM